jgi:hypothetical protein
MWLPVVGMLREMKFGIARVGIILRILHRSPGASIQINEDMRYSPKTLSHSLLHPELPAQTLVLLIVVLAVRRLTLPFPFHRLSHPRDRPDPIQPNTPTSTYLDKDPQWSAITSHHLISLTRMRTGQTTPRFATAITVADISARTHVDDVCSREARVRCGRAARTAVPGMLSRASWDASLDDSGAKTW